MVDAKARRRPGQGAGSTARCDAGQRSGRPGWRLAELRPGWTAVTHFCDPPTSAKTQCDGARVDELDRRRRPEPHEAGCGLSGSRRPVVPGSSNAIAALSSAERLSAAPTCSAVPARRPDGLPASSRSGAIELKGGIQPQLSPGAAHAAGRRHHRTAVGRRVDAVAVARTLRRRQLRPDRRSAAGSTPVRVTSPPVRGKLADGTGELDAGANRLAAGAGELNARRGQAGRRHR